MGILSALGQEFQRLPGTTKEKGVLEDDRSDDGVADFGTLPVHMLAVANFSANKSLALALALDCKVDSFELGAVWVDKQFSAVTDVQKIPHVLRLNA
jgi:hypothetical protein